MSWSGDDEDGFVHPTTPPAWIGLATSRHGKCEEESKADFSYQGMWRKRMIVTMRLRRDVTGRWRLQRIAYRKKQRDTWIHYEVRKLDMTFVIRMRIAETIDAFYGDAGTRDGVSRSYKQAVEDLDAETIKALDGPYRTTVLEPISRFCAYFPDINECIKKRNNKLLDYDAMRAKVKKLVEKPDKDATKLPRAEREAEMAKQAYEQLNEQLFTELPQLIDLRVPYLDPSFEALVKIQLRFCAEAYSRMAQVQQYLDADTRDQYANGDLDNRVEQVLQEIRDLSIAGTV
ncbi:BAR adaptor protein RVS161 [Rasamsonia emersonii CBS 393.64]|uniref:BAR adaptor protein RVS161 n=1 Tax=Rasamsonia emersonii (strain ATCC 16479 / CBS 393.64 / IMI 116815) TaxID=1408163 RepID=A0A0F4YLP3_RASE3|nr:BAR adaptor protein RVS161 [Rasamsonia emersonii CBS 393.64]KKA18538.1 BAR adaptor protein RVS161 [Rasamsonia emersonii CBS 393.64]